MQAGIFKLHLIILQLTLLSAGFAQDRNLFFVQYGDTLPFRNGAVWIDRDYFDLHINLDNGDEVLMFMSADSTDLYQVKTGTSPLDLPAYLNGTGLIEHENYRINWLLFNGKDYMLWKYQPGLQYPCCYRDSLAPKGYNIRKTITSFDFTHQGGLDGTYSAFIVPVTWLYLIYTVRYTNSDGAVMYTDPQCVKIRMM